MMPEGFHIEHNAVRPEVWDRIHRWLSSGQLPPSEDSDHLISIPIPWETGSQMQNRKIAQFGNCQYDYVNDIAAACDKTAAPIPRYICETLLSSDETQYTQCIINCYEAGNEIPWHLDHEYFGPEVLVYTFGEDRPLFFRRLKCTRDRDSMYRNDDAKECTDNSNFHHSKKREVEYDYAAAHPRHCSKYTLKGSARIEWEHSVPSGNAERISITFRSWRGPDEDSC